MSVPRVVMLLDCYWPNVGGSQAIAKTICDLLEGRAGRFTVLTRNFTGRLPRTEMMDGVPVVRIGRSRRRWISKLQFLAGAVWYLIRNRRAYDFVHLHFQQYDLDLLAVTLARLVTRKPYILHVQRSETIAWMLKLPEAHAFVAASRPNLLPRRFYRRALRGAQAIVAVDQETLQSLERHGLGRGRYVPNVVRVPTDPVGSEERTRLRRQLDLPAEAAVVCTVGVLRPEKNIITLLRAWRQLLSRWSGRPLRLLILGGVHEPSRITERELRAYAAEHGLDSVEFRGSVPNVAEFLRAADVYAHPSLVEGASLAVIEAMSSGLPVVVSDIPGNLDLVPSEEVGLLFEPMDAETLASRLERLLRDGELRRALGACAQARAREMFSVDRALAEIASLYAAVGTSNGASRT